MTPQYPERLFRIVVFSRIGNARWKQIEKHFCDNEKKLASLVRKYTTTTNRRNGIGIRQTKFVVEEFVDRLWQQIQEYPAKLEIEKDKLENTKRTRKEKWEKIMKAAEEEHKKRQERNGP